MKSRISSLLTLPGTVQNQLVPFAKIVSKQKVHLSTIRAAVASHGPLIWAKYIGAANRLGLKAQTSASYRRACTLFCFLHTFKDFELLIWIYISIHKSQFLVLFTSLLLGRFWRRGKELRRWHGLLTRRRQQLHKQWWSPPTSFLMFIHWLPFLRW